MDLKNLKRQLETQTSKTAARTASVVAMSLSMLLTSALSLPAFAANDVNHPTVRPAPTSPAGQQFAPDQIIVMPNKGLDKEDLAKSIKDIDGKIIDKDLMGMAYLVEVPKGKADVELAKS
jgi:hypothetical protein